jgi:hypothetical protein
MMKLLRRSVVVRRPADDELALIGLDRIVRMPLNVMPHSRDQVLRPAR